MTLEGELLLEATQQHATNSALDSEPEILSSAPYDAGWMLKLKLANPAAVASLLDAAAYTKLVG